MLARRLRVASMFTSTRPSSHRYQVTAVCGAPSPSSVAMTDGLGCCRNSMSSGGSGDVGSVNADLVVSVARLPRAGETVAGGTFATFGGGKGANQAVAAARAGARVTMIAAVGADDLGDEALRELAGEGIDVSRVARLE